MKRILGYFWRDKIDLIIFLATIVIATYFTLKNPTFDHYWTSLVTLWMFGAIIRMGYYTDKYDR
jgi:hypothetical protein